MSAKIEPIKIEADDDWVYTNLASLFDNPKFIEDLVQSREVLDIKEPVPFNELDAWMSKEYDEHIKKNPAKFVGGTSEHPIYNIAPTVSERLSEDVCKKYKKPLLFAQSIREAIVCGETRVSGKKTAYVRTFSPGEQVDEQLIAIIVDQDTTRDEIYDIYNNELEPLRKRLMFEKERPVLISDSEEKKIQEFVELLKQNRKSNSSKTKPSIREHREWYWAHESGMSYNEIIKKYNLGVERQAVINAVNNYKDFIKHNNN